MAWFSQEIAENAIATVVDFASILVAYNIGVHQLEITFGIAYAVLDAYIVIWLRRPITNWTKRLFNLFKKSNSPTETIKVK